MHRRLALVAAVAALGVAGEVRAAIAFPPPGSHSFIAAYEIDSGQHSCSLQCVLVSSPTVGSTLDQVTFHGANPADFITVSGATGGSALHGSIVGRDAGELDVAINDTYTVHGGAGPFDITVRLAVDGNAVSVPFGATNNAIIGANLSAIIGTFDIDPASTSFPTVDASAKKTSAAITQFNAAAFAVPLSAIATLTKTVNPGAVFDLGFEASAAYAVGGVDFSHTAVISFDLPDGVFLTSASGATFGTVPSPGGGVPEPAAWSLMIAGFGLAGAAMRARRAMA